MVIKESFRLVSKTPNVLNMSESIMRSFYNEENSPRHVFATLELKKKNFVHFTNKKIFDLISDIKKREDLKILNFDYALPVSFNKPTKDLVVNLKPFQVLEISNMSSNDLYGAIVYAYAFAMLVNKKFKISESYASIIINFMLSFYVKAFGRAYGLVGIYASEISKLKFLIACYILVAYFGHNIDKKLFSKAASLAPYMYHTEYDELRSYNFREITGFVDALSNLKVMPGLTVTKFTSTLYKYYGVNMLVALEDLSRFFSVILTSSVPGSRVVPRYLVQVNEQEYFKLVEIMRRMF